MKAIMIIYNQAHSEKIEYMLDKLASKAIHSGKMFRGGEPIPAFPTWEHMPGLKLIKVCLQLLMTTWLILYLIRLKELMLLMMR